MKRFLVMVLALCMAVSMLPVTTLAATEVDSGACGDSLTWVLAEDGTLTISGTGDMDDYRYSEAPWSDYTDRITRVQIEDGVTFIGGLAFASCQQLADVQMPDSLTHIGWAAFRYCDALSSVTIPQNVIYISDYAFLRCSSLTEIVFCGNLDMICDTAFYDVTATAYYPANFDKWTKDMLKNYGGDLTWVPYEAAAEEVDSGQCGESLEWVLTNDGLLTISGYGDMYDYDEGAPWGEYGRKICTVRIEEGVTSIGNGAFSDCYDLVAVQIPNGITSIGDYAFTSCFKLPEVTIPDGVITIGEGAFLGCSDLIEVNIPDSVTSIGARAFFSCADYDAFETQKGVHSVDTMASGNARGLRKVNIGSGVTSIGTEAFAKCLQLKDIHVDPDNPSFSSDDRGVLYDKEMKTLIQAPGALSGEYELPDSVATIGYRAMANCTYLTGVTIPASVTEIDHYAFSVSYISHLDYNKYTMEIRFEGDAPEIGFHIFWDIDAVVGYPARNETWAEIVTKSYGGNISWEPYESDCVGYDCHNFEIIVTDPTCQGGGCTTHTCTNCGESYADNYTDAVNHSYSGGACIWCGEEENLVKWYSGSTSLNGTIDLNMYVILSEKLVNDPETFVRFTFKKRVVDVPMADAEPYITHKGDQAYRFTCPLFAKQVADPVVVQVMRGDTPVGNPKEYSAMQYCRNLIRKNENPEQVAMCKAMLNYGAAAQLLFDYRTGNLANASLSESEKNLPFANVSDYRYSVTGSEDGIKARSATMMMESEIRIRVYFTLDEGRSIDEFTFTIDGVEVQPAQNDEGLWFIESQGVAAKEMEEMHDFCCGGITVRYGALSYVNSKLKSKDTLEVNLAKTLYAYYIAAERLLGTLPTTGLKLHITEHTILAGETYQIDFAYDGDAGNLTWASSHSDVATVDSNGLVTAVGRGRTYITVTDGNLSARCKIWVDEIEVYASDIELISANSPFYDGVSDFVGDYVRVVFRVANDATYKDIIVTSSDSDVVSVEAGDAGHRNYREFKLNFEGVGSAVITVQSYDRAVTKTYTVHVKSGYQCRHGGGLHTPEEWAECATSVAYENGMIPHDQLGSWRLFTLEPEELTFERAIRFGQSFVHAYWRDDTQYCYIAYAGQDKYGNYQFHECWG